MEISRYFSMILLIGMCCLFFSCRKDDDKNELQQNHTSRGSKTNIDLLNLENCNEAIKNYTVEFNTLFFPKDHFHEKLTDESAEKWNRIENRRQNIVRNLSGCYPFINDSLKSIFIISAFRVDDIDLYSKINLITVPQLDSSLNHRQLASEFNSVKIARMLWGDSGELILEEFNEKNRQNKIQKIQKLYLHRAKVNH